MIATYHKLWKQGDKSRVPHIEGYGPWPDKGIAFLGDFSGIQGFVYRPAPGVGGAARRLRSRSFRVSAYTELIARWCLQQLSVSNPKLLYTAGGKFLIATEPFDSWQNKVAHMQAQIDEWAWTNFEGELVFHLAAAPFDSGKVPDEALFSALELRRRRPLAETLQSDGNWRESEFIRPTDSNDAKCQSCGITQRVAMRTDGETVCAICAADESIGSILPQSRFAILCKAQSGVISALDLAIRLDKDASSSPGQTVLSLGGSLRGYESWLLLRHVPTSDEGRTLDFDEIATYAPGRRKWLGCLRIDADHIGRHFAELKGDPARIWGLSRLLNDFFTSTAEQLLKNKFHTIYAVYGGGDDLFVIGPWTDTLDFALALQEQLRTSVGEDLTFSAGLALAKPRDHILSMARDAAEALEKAKLTSSYGSSTGRNQICALGTTCNWEKFAEVLSQAKQVASWVESGDLPMQFLHEVVKLYDAWWVSQRKDPSGHTAASVRYRPLLYYQICRNLKPGPARQWAHSLLHLPSDWPWAGFILRYAMLAADHKSD
jgi:CRISPR-associated protein Csm1